MKLLVTSSGIVNKKIDYHRFSEAVLLDVAQC